MKNNPSDFEKFIAAPSAEIALVLLFGADEGRIRNLGRRLSDALIPSKSDPFLYVELDNDALRQDPQRLYDELSTLGLFGDRRVVRLRLDAERQPPSLASLLESIDSDKAPPAALCIVETGPLNANSALRRDVESSPRMLAVHCALETELSLRHHIETALTKTDLEIAPDALMLMVDALGENAAQTDQELEKLVLYKQGAGNRIESEDVRAIVSGHNSTKFSDIADAIEASDLPRLDRLLSAAIAENESPIGLCRAISWRFATPASSYGDRQISNLSPVQRNRAQQLMFWTDRAMKQTGAPDWAICRTLLFNIARVAGSRQKNGRA